MPDDLVLKDIDPHLDASVPTASQVGFGMTVPPVNLLQVLSAADWEQFVEEWLSFHKTKGTYSAIQRASGSGDLGLDIVAFATSNGFSDPWDSFQCKHYDHALWPSDLYGEIG